MESLRQMTLARERRYGRMITVATRIESINEKLIDICCFSCDSDMLDLHENKKTSRVAY